MCGFKCVQYALVSFHIQWLITIYEMISKPHLCFVMHDMENCMNIIFVINHCIIVLNKCRTLNTTTLTIQEGPYQVNQSQQLNHSIWGLLTKLCNAQLNMQDVYVLCSICNSHCRKWPTSLYKLITKLNSCPWPCCLATLLCMLECKVWRILMGRIKSICTSKLPQAIAILIVPFIVCGNDS